MTLNFHSLIEQVGNTLGMKRYEPAPARRQHDNGRPRPFRPQPEQRARTAVACSERGSTTLGVAPPLFVYSFVLTAYDANGDLVTGADGESSDNVFSYSTSPAYLTPAQLTHQISAAREALVRKLRGEGYDMDAGSAIFAGPPTAVPVK